MYVIAYEQVPPQCADKHKLVLAVQPVYTGSIKKPHLSLQEYIYSLLKHLYSAYEAVLV